MSDDMPEIAATKSARGPAAPLRYALRGPQIEPAASYWMYCARLRLVSIEELTAITDNNNKANSECYFPPYEPSDHPQELKQLKSLERFRDDPDALVSNDPKFKNPNPQKFLFPPRDPISRLWNIVPPPMGANFATRLPNEQQIQTGRGLARAVESETPGLLHRHVLNRLVRLRPDWSPPRQALIWAGLDVAIASALQAAWYYKWLAEDPPKAYKNGSRYPIKRRNTSYRPRPVEFDKSLTVLFDNPDELNPTRIECPPPDGKGVISVGTPRHPAYPSGHSTYAAAASEYLKYFFGTLPTPASIRATESKQNNARMLGQELDFLADNIGLGRMWAGIHWLTDHTAGMLLGRVVARLVLNQMIEMLGQESLCMPPRECPPKDKQPPPPNQSDVKKDATAFRDKCQPENRPADLPEPSDKCPEVQPCTAPGLALERAAQEVDLFELSRSPQQGGGLPGRVFRRVAGAATRQVPKQKK